MFSLIFVESNFLFFSFVNYPFILDQVVVDEPIFRGASPFVRVWSIWKKIYLFRLASFASASVCPFLLRRIWDKLTSSKSYLFCYIFLISHLWLYGNTKRCKTIRLDNMVRFNCGLYKRNTYCEITTVSGSKQSINDDMYNKQCNYGIYILCGNRNSHRRFPFKLGKLGKP